MNNTDSEYFRLIDLVLAQGRVKKNRTGIDTIGVFGEQARFNLAEGFPLLTTKKVFMKAITHELLWFLSGSTNIKYLVDNDVHIWDDWAYARYKKEKLSFGKIDLSPEVTGRHYTQSEFIEAIKYNQDFSQKYGELGEGTYGGMWRAFPYFCEGEEYPHLPLNGSVDQIQKIVDKLKNNPDDRRMIVSAWHPYWVDHCALPPCHALFQFHTEELTQEERIAIAVKHHNLTLHTWKDRMLFMDDELSRLGVPTRRLNCQLYQRSCDLGLGVPFNIASYALLTQMLAQVSGMVAGEFIHTYGDLHIYKNHVAALKEQRVRIPMDKLPSIELNPAVTDLFKFKYEDIKLKDYVSHPAIKMDVAV